MQTTDSAVPLKIYIRAEQLDQLKALAAADDRSVSALIRRAIDAYLESHKQSAVGSPT